MDFVLFAASSSSAISPDLFVEQYSHKSDLRPKLP